ncbi:rRNA adenine N(6)-methyltransferase family protein, partial [Paenibacillus sepulcri]|nr:rRNA adenine N(6)-methyltransferase family protein [Paenibacillus sepulcri]
GAITIQLAEQARRILAVENDPRLAQILRRRLQNHIHITVIEKDFLQIRLPREPYQVVANIPFFLTTPILKLLLDPQSSSLQRAVLIMDKGAAKGLTAQTIRHPRVLTWRMWYKMELVGIVPRSFFSPPPSVDSVIFSIRRKPEPCL